MCGVAWLARKEDGLSLEYVECVPRGTAVWEAAEHVGLENKEAVT